MPSDLTTMPVASGPAAEPKVLPAESIAAAAAGAAHDLNNLLTAIVSSLELALADPQLSASALEDLAHAKSSAYRGAELVRRLLAFARLSGQPGRRLDLQVVLRGFAEELRQRFPRLGLLLDLERQPIPAWGHDEQFRQILFNLACGLMEEPACQARWRLSLTRLIERHGHRYVGVEIADDGFNRTFPPVPAARMAPATGEPQPLKGASLAFFMAETLARWQGGWIESLPSLRGGRIALYFRQAEAPSNLPSAAPAADRARSRGERICVADPDEATRLWLRSLLSYRGYQVCEAADARSFIDSWPAASTEFDLLCVSLDAVEIRAWLGRPELFRASSIPIIAVASAQAKWDDSSAGIFRRLRKPLDREEVLSAIRAALDFAKPNAPCAASD